MTLGLIAVGPKNPNSNPNLTLIVPFALTHTLRVVSDEVAKVFLTSLDQGLLSHMTLGLIAVGPKNPNSNPNLTLIVPFALTHTLRVVSDEVAKVFFDIIGPRPIVPHDIRFDCCWS